MITLPIMKKLKLQGVLLCWLWSVGWLQNLHRLRLRRQIHQTAIKTLLFQIQMSSLVSFQCSFHRQELAKTRKSVMNSESLPDILRLSGRVVQAGLPCYYSYSYSYYCCQQHPFDPFAEVKLKPGKLPRPMMAN